MDKQQEAIPPDSGLAKKSTFYLQPKTVEGLEDLWLNLRKLVGRSHRSLVTKSLLVDRAVQLITSVVEGKSPEALLKILGLKPKA